MNSREIMILNSLVEACHTTANDAKYNLGYRAAMAINAQQICEIMSEFEDADYGSTFALRKAQAQVQRWLDFIPQSEAGKTING